MVKLPEKSLQDKLNAIVHESYPRPHLGGSVIGHACRRYIFYSFRWAYKNRIESRIYRIFRIGDAIEDILVKELASIGFKVRNNQAQVGGYKGHASGSIDGEFDYEGLKYLFEAKSMNHTNFLALVRKGVQESKPQHYRQCQIYMGKRELDRTWYVAMDKDTSKLYSEVIEFDEFEYEMLLAKEEETIDATHINLFPRVSNNSSWYECKSCDARFVCHHNLTPEKNCRTCKHVEIHDEGKWSCGLYQEWLTVKQQEDGCKDWECSEIFINE
jgi:hypothetical protein